MNAAYSVEECIVSRSQLTPTDNGHEFKVISEMTSFIKNLYSPYVVLNLLKWINSLVILWQDQFSCFIYGIYS